MLCAIKITLRGWSQASAGSKFGFRSFNKASHLNALTLP